jgi:hypothetical protein
MRPPRLGSRVIEFIRLFLFGGNLNKVTKIILMSLAAVIACCFVLVFACNWALFREPPWFSIPKADIVYQALNNQFDASTGKMVESNNLIGFVNADGSGNTLVKLKYRAYQPIFSLEAGGVFFHTNESEPNLLVPMGGQIYFLSRSGTYNICSQTYAEGFIIPVGATGYFLEFGGGKIELANMKTCKVIKQLVEIPNPGAMEGIIDSAYPSSSGKSIVYSESSLAPKQDVIYIMDIETRAVREVLQGGYNASFSPDDQQIAYVGDNGIYIANLNGTDSKLIVKIDFNSYSELANTVKIPYPFWSSDGTTLVYHKCNNEDCQDLSDFSIYKVDVNSGVEQKIVDGGLYPVWIK